MIDIHVSVILKWSRTTELEFKLLIWDWLIDFIIILTHLLFDLEDQKKKKGSCNFSVKYDYPGVGSDVTLWLKQ